MLRLLSSPIRSNILAHESRRARDLRCRRFSSPPVDPKCCKPTYSAPLRWRSLNRLRDGSDDRFRAEAFAPALPALMPKGHFSQLPAIQKWFMHSGGSRAHLNGSYLSTFSDAMILLELTQLATGLDDEAVNETFQRGEASFGIFLNWAEKADEETKERIYLAQAPLRDLPEVMRHDLPTPHLVLHAGKGDVYDTSIWLGMPPTYTPLHKDPNPNLFVQLAGHKVVRLLPPEAGYEVFAAVQAALGSSTSASFRGPEMMEGEEKALLEAAIWHSSTDENKHIFTGQEAHLLSGDGLFIPRGWWHSVKGIGTDITGSVSVFFLLLLANT